MKIVRLNEVTKMTLQDTKIYAEIPKFTPRYQNLRLGVKFVFHYFISVRIYILLLLDYLHVSKPSSKGSNPHACSQSEVLMTNASVFISHTILFC